MSDLRKLLEHRSVLGEGPLFDDGVYYWVDIDGHAVHRFRNGCHESKVFENELVTSVALTGKDTLLISLGQRLVLLDNFNETIELDLGFKPAKGTRFNDAKVDPWGNYWVGTMDIDFQNPKGCLYCITPNGRVKQMILDVVCSNGLCWNRDKKIFYYIDSLSQMVIAYSFDPEFIELSHGKVVYRELRPTVFPDGMCIDEHGKIWVALWGGAEVLRIDPEQKSVLDVYSLPCPNVTSCAFSGDQLDTLMITTASCDTNLQVFPKAGQIFLCDVGVKGLPANRTSLSLKMERV